MRGTYEHNHKYSRGKGEKLTGCNAFPHGGTTRAEGGEVGRSGYYMNVMRARYDTSAIMCKRYP